MAEVVQLLERPGEPRDDAVNLGEKGLGKIRNSHEQVSISRL